MQVELASAGYTALISQTGAELVSLRDPSGEEFMWSGDARYWSGRAPILFPVIGRMKDGGYNFDGRRYDMPKHGLVRRKVWELESQSPAAVEFSIRADNESLLHYPFDFELFCRFELCGPRLSVCYRVLNHGNGEMLFSLGSHPAFALPLENGEALEQWSVEFAVAETLDRQVLDGGLIGANPVANFLQSSRRVQLSETLFNDDALIFFGLQSQRLDLVHQSKGKRLSLYTGGAPDLGIWSMPGAPYVCLEPWYGHDDPVNASGDLGAKPGLLRLAAGAVFETGIEIELAR
ncbi:MAG: aldose 1-epimerase family protein [Granulosicoccaceae bacterium]